MEMKELVLLWMATALAASAMEVVDDGNKTLTAISIYPSNTTKLILHHNFITMSSLDTNALNMLPNLTELDLSYNHIAKLTDGAFSGLENLEVLNLSGNSLHTIRNETFTGLKKLKKLDLQENPWNCSGPFLKLIKWMNDSGVQTEGGTCASPEDLNKKQVLDVIKARSTPTKPPSVTTSTTTVTTAPPPPLPHPAINTTTTTAAAATSTAPPTTTGTTASPATTAQWRSHSSSFTSGKTNISNKDSLAETGNSGKQQPGVSNTWKFLAGVIVIALCTSMFIVCAVKSPSWYKMIFNYRHQRLREVEEPNIFSTGRYSNFSLDTEQTETSAHELDQGLEQPLEDEDGFIEDRYIQPEDYKDHTEDYKDHSDADEV
ncbi:uncharacterized protein [Salminus brasiliensis]|uniref:uncharacterized protein n=1 Tax=Salminus brasiliensis TaxID=930266 RepID=UPI003B8391D2